VIVQTVADARQAALGGADRLEIVRAIRVGGLTPSLALVRAVAAETRLPLRVMVRANAGFTTGARELSALCAAASAFEGAGVDGLVLGFARDGRPALDDVATVLAAAPSARATFHRAFDALDDPLAAIDAIAALPQIDRILTSGGEGPAADRCRRLAEYAARAAAAGRARARPPIETIAGGGVDEDVLSAIARTGCVREVHVGRAARDGVDREAPVSAAAVRRLRRLLEGRT